MVVLSSLVTCTHAHTRKKKTKEGDMVVERTEVRHITSMMLGGIYRGVPLCSNAHMHCATGRLEIGKKKIYTYPFAPTSNKNEIS